MKPLTNCRPATVDGLMKDDKKSRSAEHPPVPCTVSAMKADQFTDGQTLGMVNGDNDCIRERRKDHANGTAHVIASIPASTA